MRIFQNISLKPYNTFGIEAKASQFVELNTLEEVQVLCKTFNLSERKLLILGGGSNILLTKDFDGMAIKINLKGIQVLQSDEDTVLIEAMAGEVWHDFVMYCVQNNLGGVENLSLIPGCVGAAPMQNIGAYGAEIKQVFDSLTAVEIASGELVTFTNEQCEFGYRESVFKNKHKGKYIIVSVTFKLNKKPALNHSYGAIQEVLQKAGIAKPGIQDISNAVIEIRKSKLPDPAILGNAGSFFKNPEITIDAFNHLKNQYPDMPGYITTENTMKVPAGWLIEQCNWKGKMIGNTGAHKNQALVLVNYGAADGNEVLNLAKQIQESVRQKFNIQIQAEVNIIE
jgi:UDP-N-acetylmuramate dehydrogenase